MKKKINFEDWLDKKINKFVYQLMKLDGKKETYEEILSNIQSTKKCDDSEFQIRTSNWYGSNIHSDPVFRYLNDHRMEGDAYNAKYRMVIREMKEDEYKYYLKIAQENIVTK